MGRFRRLAPRRGSRGSQRAVGHHRLQRILRTVEEGGGARAADLQKWARAGASAHCARSLHIHLRRHYGGCCASSLHVRWACARDERRLPLTAANIDSPPLFEAVVAPQNETHCVVSWFSTFASSRGSMSWGSPRDRGVKLVLACVRQRVLLWRLSDNGGGTHSGGEFFLTASAGARRANIAWGDGSAGVEGALCQNVQGRKPPGLQVAWDGGVRHPVAPSDPQWGKTGPVAGERAWGRAPPPHRSGERPDLPVAPEGQRRNGAG